MDYYYIFTFSNIYLFFYTKIYLIFDISTLRKCFIFKVRIFHFIFEIFKSNKNNTNIIRRILFHAVFYNSISYFSAQISYIIMNLAFLFISPDFIKNFIITQRIKNTITYNNVIIKIKINIKLHPNNIKSLFGFI